jgi:hypothetical protein
LIRALDDRDPRLTGDGNGDGRAPAVGSELELQHGGKANDPFDRKKLEGLAGLPARGARTDGDGR